VLFTFSISDRLLSLPSLQKPSDGKHYLIYSGGNVLRTRVENNALQNAMQKLSPEQRCVVVLEIIKGFSNEDEADLLAKSIGTVKNTRNRALLILIHLLYSEYDLVYT